MRRPSQPVWQAAHGDRGDVPLSDCMRLSSCVAVYGRLQRARVLEYVARQATSEARSANDVWLLSCSLASLLSEG